MKKIGAAISVDQEYFLIWPKSIFHTRSMRRSFREKCNNLSKMTPSVPDFIYKALALDSTTAYHKDMEERICLVFLVDHGIIQDLRHLNVRRPTKTFDNFLEKLSAILESITAEDDRRHGVGYLAIWI